jgi:acyl transferase domain-containing protein
VEGEELALRRAYNPVEIDPLTVGLVEAHGTESPRCALAP